MAGQVKDTYRINGFQWLVRTVFRDIYDGHTKKVWVLGAGASIDSGICGAGDLTHRWSCQLLNLPETTSKEDNLKTWAREELLRDYGPQITRLLKAPGPDGRKLDDFLAQRYFEVYSRRFSGNPDSGYEMLRREMDGKLPSVGYLVLAQLISTNSNLVVTVNFDSLISDALFLTGKSLPLVLDHENVAHLVRPDRTNSPLVCKIHRDLLKNPMSTEEELRQLNGKWELPLNEIFKYYCPIFLGYGGNDHTLMSHLEKVDTFLPTPIWLHYTKIDLEDHDAIRAEVSAPISSFLDKHKGILVPYTGFDKLMFYTRKELNMADVLDTFDHRSSTIRLGLESKINELAGETGESSSVDPISRASVDSIKHEKLRTIDEWIAIASSESDLKKRVAIYDQAIKEKEHPWLYNNRGVAKHDQENFLEAIKDYGRALEISPDYAYAHNNRGLANKKLGHYEEALPDYNRAIELDPRYVSAYNNRGSVKNLLGRYEEAIEDYSKAIEINSKYAIAYYNRGIAKNNLGRYEEAIQDYDLAINFGSNDADSYEGRAIAKRHLKRYDDALEDYNSALKLEPKRVRLLYNIARIYALLKMRKEAVEWLDQTFALDRKLIDRVLGDSDFASIRRNSEYKALLAKYKI